jgi:exo-1,4-beta-D-glucosaminidase
LQLPELPPETTTTVYFVQLNLKDSVGKSVSSNFYWLSTKKPVLDWEKTTYISTPITTYEDMTMLSKLPKVKVATTASGKTSADGYTVRVQLKNPSEALAFQVRLAVEAGDPGVEVLPVLWEDNYVSLMPGEEREVEARFIGKHAIGLHPTLKVTGWNIEPASVGLAETAKATPKKR